MVKFKILTYNLAGRIEDSQNIRHCSRSASRYSNGDTQNTSQKRYRLTLHSLRQPQQWLVRSKNVKRIFPQPPVISFLFGLNMPLSGLFSHTLSICSPEGFWRRCIISLDYWVSGLERRPMLWEKTAFRKLCQGSISFWRNHRNMCLPTVSREDRNRSRFF
jgi:hypothetical protein